MAKGDYVVNKDKLFNFLNSELLEQPNTDIQVVANNIGDSYNLCRISETFTEYSNFVERLFKAKEGEEGAFVWNITHAALGIAGEAGETVDLIKKTFANGRELDMEKLVKEMGDLMFYIQALSNVIEIPLSTIIQTNMDKLNKRYPDGYSDAAALARKDEVNVLEVPATPPVNDKHIIKINFDNFIKVGIDFYKANNLRLVGELPWNFLYYGAAVSHETNEKYIIGDVHFNRGDTLVYNFTKDYFYTEKGE
jgi:NTP pyrophosphatase (non-canonical NTP hydrolase)